MNNEHNENHTKKLSLEALSHRQEKIISLLHDEQRRAKEKFPLAYALIATFGLVATIAGFGKLIDKIDFLKQNPAILIVIGVSVLLVTGAVYNKRSN